ncbi:hypothetical protein [Actimicrobium antarcticum]|uniref:Uncharacterized protein n=1 Tax=Actimicrobium antarcticum TaxID=1051899 RepID=A0ABP7TWC8_9BURK
MPETTLCALHQVTLVSEPAEILYGVHAAGRNFEDARTGLFPNSFLTISGGCFYSPDYPKHKQVMCCRSCREVERSWTNLMNRPFSETFD